MLEFEHLTLHRGTKLLFQDATFRIHASQRVAVTGANGSGKSSLFAAILGELTPTRGELRVPPQWTIAHVAQETPAVDRSALEFTLDGDRALRNLQDALSTAELEDDGLKQAHLHSQLEALDAYTAPSRATQILYGLGFEQADVAKPVRAFSGGWRMRLNLAQVLMCRSDLLLLDEPTNHLDLDAVIWLEDFLRGYRGTLMLISHDRDFVDRVVDHVISVQNESLQLFRGNYSDFEQYRVQQTSQLQAAYARQQREIAHIQKFVSRFRAQASKARQAQSRLKALERMELIAPAHFDSPFRFSFPAPQRIPNPLLQLDRVSTGYGERTILRDIVMSLRPADRIGLLGRNGAGKSTLIKLMAGLLPVTGGQRVDAQDLRIGYFAQHQVEQLQPHWSALEHFRAQDRTIPERELRDFLGGFGFTGDMATDKIEPFSGGEKARLALALLVRRAPNVLLLDEPTNHLDLEMRHALNVALQDYTGALVLVSHDRFLLRSVTDQFLLVADGGVRPFDGDLENYRSWLEQERTRPPVPAAENESKSVLDRKDRRRLLAGKRQRLAPLKQKVTLLERELQRLTQQRDQLDSILADPAVYTPEAKMRLKETSAQRSAVLSSLKQVENDWLAAAEALDAAESEADDPPGS